MISINANDENYKSYEKVFRAYNALKHFMGAIVMENILRSEGDVNYKTPEGQPDLLQAVIDHPTAASNPLHCLLYYGYDFTWKNNQGETVVHKFIQEIAIDKDKAESSDNYEKRHVIRCILDAHMELNEPSNPCDSNGISHFHAACLMDEAFVVEFFLKNGVDVDQAVNADSTFYPSYTPLHFAVKYTRPAIVEVLLKYGANLQLKNAEGLTPLHFIARRKIIDCDIVASEKFVRMLNFLIEHTIDHDVDSIEATDNFGFCKYYLAYILQDESLVDTDSEQFENIDRIVNLDSLACTGYTALHFAAFCNVKIFKLLLAKGANIEAKNAAGQTPFDLCLQNYGAKDTRAIILSKKEWANMTLSDNKTKLLDIVSAMETVEEFISFMNCTESALTMYVPFDSPLWPGYTLLHLAVLFAKKDFNPHEFFLKFFLTLNENTQILIECLERGADVTVADTKGSTALHLAFYLQKREVVKCLLEHHDKATNPVDGNYLSHFHIACMAGDLKAVKHFLEKAVNIESQVLATYNWYVNITEGSTDWTKHLFIHPGSTALHMSVACENNKITEELVKYQANVNAQDVNGLTPVHRLLCGFRYRPDSLLKVQHPKNITTGCGLSYLHVACYFADYKDVEDLLGIEADPKSAIVYTSKLKEYDEIFIDTQGNNKKFSFLLNCDGFTPLHFFWRHRWYDKLTDFWRISFMLIQRNPEVFTKKCEAKSLLQILLEMDRFHESYFQYAAANKSTALQKSLEEEFGITTLHIACSVVDIKLVEKEIKRGANINAQVKTKSPIWQGFTPLHCAVEKAFRNNGKKIFNELTKVIRLLIKHGANPFLADHKNDTAFHLIRDNQPYKLWKAASFVPSLLQSMHNSYDNPTDRYGFSIFHIACALQNKVAIKKFLKRGVDVNHATSHSWYSGYPDPGRTGLHFVINNYEKISRDTISVFSDETFLQTIDMLIRHGANVNATDYHGETPLFKAVELKRLRQILIEKLISNGADVHVRNVHGNNTAFEILLMQGNATWKEIKLFMKAGCQLNGYNSISKEGYMARFFRFQLRKTLSADNIMENPVFTKILNSPEILKNNDVGQTAIHKVVSINYKSIDNDKTRKCNAYGHPKYYFLLTREQKMKAPCKPVYHPKTTYKEYYADLIEQLCIRGCDIDHQDNEGKTALHLAAAFKNNRAILSLLKNGADINIADKDSKTAYAYAAEISELFGDPWNEYHDTTHYKYTNPTVAHIIFAVHVYKLEFCQQSVSDQNKHLQTETFKIIGPIPEGALKCFYKEMEKTKSVNIGTTAFSLYEFLTDTRTHLLYMNMTNEERREVDQFFQNVGKFKFLEIDGLLRLKDRQTVLRTTLIEPALASLNQLIKYQLPDLCCRYILKFLQNEDLKGLIASTD